MMRLLIAAIALLCTAGAVRAAGPTVTSIVARQLTDGTGRVSITYNLADSDSATVHISVAISTDGGSTYTARNYVTGDVGSVRPGRGRRVVWDARADMGASAVFPGCKVRITADDSSGGVYPGEMVYIPAGSFLMGNSGVGDDAGYPDTGELPQHSVYLSGYYIGKYEVTRGEYRQFMDAGGYSNPAYWSPAGWCWKAINRSEPSYWGTAQDWGEGYGYRRPFSQTDDYPVVGVSYYEAEAFCNWAGGHLPTEAEWENAARWTGSHANVYPWGDTWENDKCNNLYDSSPAGGGYYGFQTASVGSYPKGASHYGCEDMAGNVLEWCQDWYRPYPGGSTPSGYSDSYRVLRGGSWIGGGRYGDRCAYRISYSPYYTWYYFGFRLAR